MIKAFVIIWVLSGLAGWLFNGWYWQVDMSRGFDRTYPLMIPASIVSGPFTWVLPLLQKPRKR